MCGQWIITKAWARPWSYETLSTTHISCSQECELPIVWHPGTQLMLGQHRQLPDISCLRDKCATHYKTRSRIIMRPNWEVSGQSLYSFSKPPSQLQVSPSMTPKKIACVTDLHHSECYFCIICVNSWMKFPRHIFSTLANSMKMPKCKRALSFKGKKAVNSGDFEHECQPATLILLRNMISECTSCLEDSENDPGRYFRPWKMAKVQEWLTDLEQLHLMMILLQVNHLAI